MKSISKFLSLLIFILVFNLLPNELLAQCSVTSTEGYTVNIFANPTSVNAPSSDCRFGYNYTVNVDYSVSFSGVNQPSSLYTMNGYLQCGSNSHFFSMNNDQSSGSSTTSNSYSNNTDCESATPTSLNCNSVNFTIEGPGISTQTINCSSSGSLPIELSDFSAEYLPLKGTKIIWVTLSEINNDYFTVERSTDAKTWYEIFHEEGAGNSTKKLTYTFIDTDELETAYYRLKQTDFNGNFSYSEVQVVNRIGYIQNEFKVYPNPAQNQITISSPAAAEYSFWTLDGRNVTHLVRLNGIQNFDISRLHTGIYLIRGNGNVARLNKVN